jgi:hypothetical protein
MAGLGSPADASTNSRPQPPGQNWMLGASIAEGGDRMTRQMTDMRNGRSTWTLSPVAMALLVTFSILGCATGVFAQSGQTAFGQVVVEPSIDYASGNTIFLLTPNKSPLPSKSNPQAWAPMYIVMYPGNSTIDPGMLNCQPSNCDHLNVLPFPAPAYPNGGTTCVKYGFPASQCGLVAGHDHLVGVPHTGDFNVAWQVILVVFTPKAVTDGAINRRMLTFQDIADAVTSGDAFEADTAITFNCSIVPATVYYNGVPRSGF